MNTVRAAAVRVMSPATETSVPEVAYSGDEVAA
jgi:hypothetical protein